MADTKEFITGMARIAYFADLLYEATKTKNGRVVERAAANYKQIRNEFIKKFPDPKSPAPLD